ncbi:hypothetical protein L484_009462 [Morus notabilis]|uniref:MalT-like TPR region domain-containing protein n=1 Tax=Morus notabilis TaxID=981085 RepID=W9RWH3_9ROSA|nr:hypothetical protein L484_009462 [Morus notabilis]
MLNTAAKHLSRALTSRLVHRTAKLGLGPTYLRPSILERSPPSRFLHDGISGSTGNHVSVSLQMINYAFSHARSHKSDDSYGESMLVLEQCLGQAHDNDDSKALVFMAMSTLLSERGNYDDAIEKLKGVQDLSLSSIGNLSGFGEVAAMEALVGLHLELGQDDSSKVLADKCLEILGQNELESSGEGGEIIRARAKAVKGLVELVHGNIQSAESFFIVPGDNKGLTAPEAYASGCAMCPENRPQSLRFEVVEMRRASEQRLKR